MLDERRLLLEDSLVRNYVEEEWVLCRCLSDYLSHLLNGHDTHQSQTVANTFHCCTSLDLGPVDRQFDVIECRKRTHTDGALDDILASKNDCLRPFEGRHAHQTLSLQFDQVEICDVVIWSVDGTSLQMLECWHVKHVFCVAFVVESRG